MEPEQLQQLATDAELGHWPPHLGLTTDVARIEYLAQQLRDAADVQSQADALSEENETLTEERDSALAQVHDLTEKLTRIRELAQ